MFIIPAQELAACTRSQGRLILSLRLLPEFIHGSISHEIPQNY